MPHLVLVGSWTEFVYKEAGMLPGFDPNIRTRDVDFLVRNLRKPNPPAGLSGIARERGAKAEKDMMAVSGIMPFLDKSTTEELLGRLSKKERMRAIRFMEAAGLNSAQFQ